MHAIRFIALTTFATPFFVGLTGCPSSQTPACAPNQVFDASSGACVALGGGSCPPGTQWNGASCAAQPQTCPPGTQWNGASCAAQPPSCPPGAQWNGTACVGVPAPTGGACAPAQAADPTAMMVASQALTALAQTKAPGMKPLGGASGGMFQAGQCVETQVTLTPGKCYTAVASGVGVSEVDVQLILAAGPVNQTIAQDNTTGPTAVLGESPNCFKWLAPIPGTVKLVLKASAGQGPAAVQLFEK